MIEQGKYLGHFQHETAIDVINHNDLFIFNGQMISLTDVWYTKQDKNIRNFTITN